MKQFEQLYMDKFGILQGLKCSMICVLHATFILSELYHVQTLSGLAYIKYSLDLVYKVSEH